MVKSRLTPHGEGFSFVDYFEKIDENKGKGEKYFHGHEEFFIHHFPEKPILPAVFIIECVAQVAGIIVGKSQDHLLFIASIDHFKIIHPVFPQQKVTSYVTVEKNWGIFTQFYAECFVLDQKIAHGLITFSQSILSGSI